MAGTGLDSLGGLERIIYDATVHRHQLHRRPSPGLHPRTELQRHALAGKFQPRSDLGPRPHEAGLRGGWSGRKIELESRDSHTGEGCQGALWEGERVGGGWAEVGGGRELDGGVGDADAGCSDGERATTTLPIASASASLLPPSLICSIVECKGARSNWALARGESLSINCSWKEHLQCGVGSGCVTERHVVIEQQHRPRADAISRRRRHSVEQRGRLRSRGKQ